MGAREYLGWRAYLRAEDDRADKTPGKQDVLLAQVAFQVYLLRLQVAGLFAKKAPKVELQPSTFVQAAFPGWKPARAKKRKPRLVEWKHVPDGLRPPPVLTREALQKLNQEIHVVSVTQGCSAGGNPAAVLTQPRKESADGTGTTNPTAGD